MTLLDLVVVAAVLALLFWLLQFDRRPSPTPPPPVPATTP
jgi:hypothetical protein